MLAADVYYLDGLAVGGGGGRIRGGTGGLEDEQVHLGRHLRSVDVEHGSTHSLGLGVRALELRVHLGELFLGPLGGFGERAVARFELRGYGQASC